MTDIQYQPTHILPPYVTPISTLTSASTSGSASVEVPVLRPCLPEPSRDQSPDLYREAPVFEPGKSVSYDHECSATHHFVCWRSDDSDSCSYSWPVCVRTVPATSTCHSPGTRPSIDLNPKLVKICYQIIDRLLQTQRQGLCLFASLWLYEEAQQQKIPVTLHLGWLLDPDLRHSARHVWVESERIVYDLGSLITYKRFPGIKRPLLVSDIGRVIAPSSYDTILQTDESLGEGLAHDFRQYLHNPKGWWKSQPQDLQP